MTNHAAEAGTPEALLENRRQRILESLDRPVVPVRSAGAPLAESSQRSLLLDAEELYWNELAWEELTDEERVDGGHLTELVFPGLLSFVNGLLLQSGAAEGPEPAQPRPEVVEQILLFLAQRFTEATRKLEQGADSGNLVWARAMTSQLIDLVLYRLYQLTPVERERLEGNG